MKKSRFTESQIIGVLKQVDYNDERPHESLGNLPPRIYRQKLENSNLAVSHSRGSGHTSILLERKMERVCEYFVSKY